MANTELKPCPFCGGKVELKHTEHKDLKHRKHFYSCTMCEAAIFLKARGKYVSAEQTETEAEELWNRRADNG